MPLRNSSQFFFNQFQIIFLILFQVSLSRQFHVDNTGDLQHGDTPIELKENTKAMRQTLFSALKKTGKVLPLVPGEDPVTALHPQSQDADETSHKTGQKEVDLERAPRNYTGWRIVRIYPPTRDAFEDFVQTFEDNTHIVVLEIIKGKLMIDVALPPNMALKDTLPDSLSPSLCCLDPDKANGRGRGGKSRARLWARKIMDTCRGRQYKEDSEDKRGKKKAEEVVAWKTVNPFLSPYSTRQLDGTEQLAWDDYYRYDSIVRFAKELALNYSTVEYLEIGQSVEGRTLFALLFSNKPKVLVRKYKRKMMQQEKQRADRPRDPPLLKSKGRKKTNRMKGRKQFVLIEAGAHAREWLSPAMATFLAQKLADAGKKFLQHVAVVLVPMANPDGYEFSHTDDRLWRKNRRNTSKSECRGVDLNRNWSKSWGTSGSSSNPCSEIYRGPQSFSEPESRALRDLARVWIKKFTLFLSLHSYGSYILYPWSHTQTASARNRPLKNIARKITKYLKTNGYKNFLYGQTSSTLYQASGTSEDYMLTAGIKYDYTVELPGFSFQFNVKKIKSVSRAFWEMLVCIFGDIGKQKKLKEYCSKRIVKIMLEDGSSYSDWVDKEIPLDEAKDIVREKYKEKHKNKVQTTTAVNTSLPAATKETMGGF